MDTDYQPFLKQAVDMQYKFHDVVDQPSDPMAARLKSEIQNLVNDAKTKRNPRDMENRIKAIQQQLKDVRAQGGQTMDTAHCDTLWQSYEQMRMNLRNFQNY